jgi:antitoxin (DNA-binding transcriptional repressor) of toxin-antitoxin stability system
MSTISLLEAKTHLPELLNRMQPGESCLIVDAGETIAQIKKVERTVWPCKAGSAKGRIWMADDFDAPLEEFKEYME